MCFAHVQYRRYAARRIGNFSSPADHQACRGDPIHRFVIGPTIAFKVTNNSRFRCLDALRHDGRIARRAVFAVFSYLFGAPTAAEVEAPVSTREPRARGCDSLHVLQFWSHPLIASRHSCDGSGNLRSRLVNRRDHWTTEVVLRSSGWLSSHDVSRFR